MSKCKVCRCDYAKTKSFQQWCSPECGFTLAKEKIERQQREKVRKENALDRKKREEMKTLPTLKKEAQQSFNKYVRLRDYGKNCISCSVSLRDSDLGGGYDAGHYRSVGSAPHLRFDESNVHGQCKRCNRWGSGMAVDYRIRLLERLGLDTVEKLEADQTPRHYTRDNLREIRDTYRRKANELEKARNAD